MIQYKLVFELFQKLHMQSAEWKGKKLQKLEYLENEKSFLDEIKNIFHDF